LWVLAYTYMYAACVYAHSHTQTHTHAHTQTQQNLCYFIFNTSRGACTKNRLVDKPTHKPSAHFGAATMCVCVCVRVFVYV